MYKVVARKALVEILDAESRWGHPSRAIALVVSHCRNRLLFLQ